MFLCSNSIGRLDKVGGVRFPQEHYNFTQIAMYSKGALQPLLDGVIDAEWIESMNTVMDDNKMLTLASNERIPLTASMRMVFEISHLTRGNPTYRLHKCIYLQRALQHTPKLRPLFSPYVPTIVLKLFIPSIFFLQKMLSQLSSIFIL